jgi:Fe-S-cluster containining protein
MDRLDDGWCAALDRDTLRCRIYAQRPLICREFEMGGSDCLAERAGWTGA